MKSTTSNEVLQNIKYESDLQRAARKKQQKNAVAASESLDVASLFVPHAVVQPAAVVIHAEHAGIAARAVLTPANPLDFAGGAESLSGHSLASHDFDVSLL